MADARNALAVRVAQGNGIIDEIRAPEGMGLQSCALGCPNRTELLLCTAPDYDDVNRAAEAEAILYVVELDR
jgi:hypothetical protein